MRRFLFAATAFALICVAVGTMIIIGFGGIPRLAGAVPPQPAASPATPHPTIAVFNMAAVMKNFAKAKRQNDLLDDERKTLMADVVSQRAEYTKLQNDIKSEQNPMLKDQMEKRRLEMARQIEDEDRRINKKLNEKALAIISSVYDEIKVVVDKTAELNGYDSVFAYPDATSPEETKSAHIKELKLKPPAAQPFFVAKRVDVTGVVIQTLNVWYPPAPSAPIVPAGVQIPNSPTPMK